MTRSTLAVMRVGEHDLPIPAYAKEGDAGMDLRSTVTTIIPKLSWVLISTGFAFEIPDGYVGLVKDRSGFAWKHGISTIAGVIDSGYRGEVKIVMVNHSEEAVDLKAGDRIAQMLIQPAPQFTLVEVPELSATVRGDKGFGSSGVK